MANKFRPRRSFHLYKDDPNHFVSKDSEMIDRLVREHIDIGGVVVYVYKLLGTPPQTRNIVNEPTEPDVAGTVNIQSLLGVQDFLYGEIRDREYDLDHIPRLRGVFKVSQNDMIYGKFGPQGLNNDVFSIEFHTRTVEEQLIIKKPDGTTVGRRFIEGDVLEFPHLADVSGNGNITPKLYSVARVMKAPSGWDPRYSNHILGLILKPVHEQQEFIQIFERKDQYGKTLAEQVSAGPGILELNAALAEEAARLAPNSTLDNEDIYYDPHNKHARINKWYDKGIPPDGIPYGKGPEFPLDPNDFDYFLRIDMLPNRLFQFYDGIWNTKQIDTNLKWQPYAWVRELEQFLGPQEDDHK